MIHTHRRQKAVRPGVVDNNLSSTTNQYPFFTRETASRRQLKFFAFGCRQFAPQKDMFFGCRRHTVVDKKKLSTTN